MWNMLWPVLIVVGANTVYHISAKSTPSDINSFASLSVSYLVAAVCSLILYFMTAPNKNIVSELGKANWTAYALGVAIIGLEFGSICIYRAGWRISTANLFASIAVACVLLLVGLFFYRETLGLRQIVGIAVCLVGLVLIVR